MQPTTYKISYTVGDGENEYRISFYREKVESKRDIITFVLDDFIGSTDDADVNDAYADYEESGSFYDPNGSRDVFDIEIEGVMKKEELERVLFIL